MLKRTLGATTLTLGIVVVVFISAPSSMGSENDTIADVIGPEGGDNSCEHCHAKETEAWKHTAHFRTYAERHRSDRAKEILENLGIRSMKRSDQCLGCHYTSVLEEERPRVRWGVTCESCHGPGRQWNDLHNKVGGDPAGKTLQWGEGRQESAEQRAVRLGAAAAKGMIRSDMIYEIANNCFGCHTVPDEALVNTGKHKAGSDYDLVAWSQGEVRHNFLSSPGAPDNPTNRPASAEEKRVLYVVGAMVDLEHSLRNLAGVQEKGGDFHNAMISRVNAARKKVDAIVVAAGATQLAAAVKAVPATVDASTTVDAGLADKLGEATREFVKNTGDLSAIDSQIPTDYKGAAFE